MAIIGSITNWGEIQGEINDYNDAVTGVISNAELIGGQVVGMRGLKGNKGDTGDTGNGIASITKVSTVGLVDTYKIAYTNGSETTFTVTNGEDGHSPVITTNRVGKTVTILADSVAIGSVEDGVDGIDGQDGVGISSINKTASIGLVDTYTITYTDSSTSTFAITNGKDGTDGVDGQDGFSPIANVSKAGDTATITITDENGTTTATVKDGTDGQDGQDGHSPVVTASKVGDTTTVYVDGTPIAEIEDGQDAGVIDLGNIDPSEYEDDREVFLNTLLDDGIYRFVWEDGDDFEYYVVVESMLDNGYVYQKYWYSEEGSGSIYHCSLRVEDGEVVERHEDNYMTTNEASIAFAIKNHGHFDAKNDAMSVLDWCDSNALTFDNTKPFIVYTDTLNSKNWLIERYATVRQPNYRFIRVYDMSDASHFYMRSGSHSGNTTIWGSWKEYQSGGGGGVSDVTIDGTSIVTGGVAELETVTQLRDGIMTATDKQKLDGIESGAEVNVQSDWNANSGDAQILNKPSIPANTSDLVNDSGFVTSPNVVYCTCDTTAGTAAKVATIVSGTLTSLTAGDQAIVKFVNTNTASNPTLNIASTGAKAIKRYGTTSVGTTQATSWTAGATFTCVYDGTNWALVSWINTAYSEISEANITNGTSSSTGVISGRRAKKAVEAFAPVTDVKVDGVSVLNGGVAGIDLTGKSNVGHTHTLTDITDYDGAVFYAAYGVTTYQEIIDALQTMQVVVSYNAGSGDYIYATIVEEITVGNSHTLFFASFNGTTVYGFVVDNTDTWQVQTVNLADTSMIPANISDLTNDSGFLDKSDILDIFYPIGSYYETSDTTFDPERAWGGTWVLEDEGQVHVSAGIGAQATYQVNGALTDSTDGGEATHTLTGAESGQKAVTISSSGGHKHTVKAHYNADKVASGSARAQWSAGGSSNSTGMAEIASDTGTHTHSISAENATTAHNNMQPYIVVNRWHRTA